MITTTTTPTDSVIVASEHVLRRLAADLRPQRSRVLGAFAAFVLSTISTVAVAWTVRLGIDRGVEGASAGALAVAVAAGVVFVLLAALGQGLGIAAVARIGESYLRDLRVGLIDQTLHQPLDLFETERTGRLVARLTSDVEAVQELLMNGFALFVQSALILVFALASLFIMSWELALATLSLLIPLSAVTVWFRRRARTAYDRVRNAIASVLNLLQENLTGIREVQAHSRGGHRVASFGRTNEAHYDRQIDAARISCVYFPAVEYVGVAALAIVIGYGGWRAISGAGTVTIGTITAFLLLVGNVFDPIQHLSQLYNVVQSAQAALRRIYGLLDLDLAGAANGEETFGVTPTGTRSGSGARVGFDNVSYRYPSSASDALTGVTLDIEPGERIALVGQTGAGKSTLAKLLVRFHEPTTGRVLLDGTDIKRFDETELRRRVLLVPQEGHIFSGTLADNIRFGDPAAPTTTVHAAGETCGVDEIAAALPNGYETVLGRGGATLSAGQRQLVGLARIVLADPELLVLDEATSALDPAAELRVESAIAAVARGRTTVVIVHRLTTASRCDRIGLLADGRLSQLGTHDELVGLDGAYARLWAEWSTTGP